jgi:phosphopantetheine--protein transferase-like protein
MWYTGEGPGKKNMRIAAGIDLVRIARLFAPDAPLNWNDPFVKRAFSDDERAQAREREGEAAQKAYLATRFAGKEAVFKAISQYVPSFSAREIQVIDEDGGRPKVTLGGTTKEMIDAGLAKHDERVSLDVSLTFEDEYAAATAVALYETRN